MLELTYPRVKCLELKFLKRLNTGKYMHIERKTSMAQSKRLLMVVGRRETDKRMEFISNLES